MELKWSKKGKKVKELMYKPLRGEVQATTSRGQDRIVLDVVTFGLHVATWAVFL